ncbi:MAG: hypothetical protein AAGA77_24985, partial [Bacteroidota bacterium]
MKKKARDAAQILTDLTKTVAVAVSLGQSQLWLNETGFNSNNPEPPHNYGRLAVLSAINPSWSIIPMNYDCLLDWSFQMAEASVKGLESVQCKTWLNILNSTMKGNSIEVTKIKSAYVKLHGSLYLYSCHNFDCTHYLRPFAKKNEWENGAPTYFSLKNSNESCPVCNYPALDLIIPPGRNKGNGEGFFYKTMNQVSKQVLSISDCWVILGYSCPEYDEDVLNMFKSAAAI